MSIFKRLFGKNDESASPLLAPQPKSFSPARGSPSPTDQAEPETTAQDALSAATDRVIRVFISSTFRDMQAERELLVKKVFPELRRICDERFVSFTEVDLRWGITKEVSVPLQILLTSIYPHRSPSSTPYYIPYAR